MPKKKHRLPKRTVKKDPGALSRESNTALLQKNENLIGELRAVAIANKALQQTLEIYDAALDLSCAHTKESKEYYLQRAKDAAVPATVNINIGTGVENDKNYNG